MPALVVTDEGERYLLDRAIRTPWLADEKWQLRLFVNDFAPCKDMVLSDLTEASAPGYAAVDLVRADWTNPVSVTGVATSWNGTAPKEFDALSGVTTVYGYYITVPTPEVFLLAQRFDAAVIWTSGAPLLLVPQLTLHSEYEPACPPPPPPPP